MNNTPSLVFLLEKRHKRVHNFMLVSSVDVGVAFRREYFEMDQSKFDVEGVEKLQQLY